MAETYDRDQWGVIRALDDLGINEDAIAARLAALGVKGVPRDSCRCVLSSYLRGLFGDDIDVTVQPGEIRVSAGLDEDVSVWPSKPLADLIESFDSHVYPDLIKESA